jgi:4-alpha-glucanotransferase
MPPAPPPRPSAWGVEASYEAADGERVATSPDTIRALLAAMGAAAPEPPPAAVRTHIAGTPLRLPGGHTVEDEGGRVVPDDVAALPAGYYTLRDERGAAERLVVAPPTCHLPPDLRGWAWAAQLYAVRSERSWGIGDLADLRRLATWARVQGAATVLVNPLHAPRPGTPQQSSPYFPSSRLYRNPLYLRVEDVPGADAAGVAEAAEAGRALNRDRHIDRDRVYRLKLTALERIFDAAPADEDAFRAYRAAEGGPLDEFAAFCALCECHGGPWWEWPAPLRHPRTAVARVAADPTLWRRARFHRWLQWQLDRQLAAAADELPPLHDIAVGVDPTGADAWSWQDVLAAGVTVGAPPDPFAPDGQDWGVRAFDPWKLRASGYEPFIRTLRAAFRHGAGARIDHVMGLFRLYWVPEGDGAARGGYVRYPARDLLAILALESRRAGAVVVGEDLGTVEPAVREELARRRVLSYRLLWFEDRPPRAYPVDALAALTTHDLPTLAGVWGGTDTDPRLRAQLVRYAGARDGRPVEDVAAGVYRALAAAPSRLVAATLEDALGIEERPNRPGTVSDRNWSVALPVTLEELVADPRAARLAGVLRR